MPDRLLVTWKEIAEFFQVSESKIRKYKDELQACGAIWYTKIGRPAQPRVCAWPSVLKAWIARKSSKGEIL